MHRGRKLFLNIPNIEKKIPEGYSRQKLLYQVPNFPQPSQSRTEKILHPRGR